MKKGSFTVEAVILVPMLILLTFVFVYFSIFVYDKALMLNDANAIAMKAHDPNVHTEKSINEICNEEFCIIREEHPYLAIKNLEMNLEKEGLHTKVIISGDWEVPVWEKYFSTVSASAKINNIDPVMIMYTTENIERIKEESDEISDDL